MAACILSTESVVYFTPSAVTLNDHEHVTIGVAAPAAITKRHRNAMPVRDSVKPPCAFPTTSRLGGTTDSCPVMTAPVQRRTGTIQINQVFFLRQN